MVASPSCPSSFRDGRFQECKSGLSGTRQDSGSLSAWAGEEFIGSGEARKSGLEDALEGACREWGWSTGWPQGHRHTVGRTCSGFEPSPRLQVPLAPGVQQLPSSHWVLLQPVWLQIHSCEWEESCVCLGRLPLSMLPRFTRIASPREEKHLEVDCKDRNVHCSISAWKCCLHQSRVESSDPQINPGGVSPASWRQVQILPLKWSEDPSAAARLEAWHCSELYA